MGTVLFAKRTVPNTKFAKETVPNQKRKEDEKQMKQINGTMLQYFEWYLDVPEGLWNKIKKETELD